MRRLIRRISGFMMIELMWFCIVLGIASYTLTILYRRNYISNQNHICTVHMNVLTNSATLNNRPSFDAYCKDNGIIIENNEGFKSCDVKIKDRRYHIFFDVSCKMYRYKVISN